MQTNFDANSKTVRLAAALFMFLSVPLALWGESYIPGKIFVAQDPVATANNLLANEFVFRVSIFSHMAGFMIFVLMMLLFYRVFCHVDKHLSRLMMIPIIAMVSIAFVLELLNYSAVMVLKSEPRATFDATQQQELAYFLMRMQRYGTGATKYIIGISFIPFGMLVYRSGFVPRIIGTLIFISGVGYFLDTCFYILLDRPDYAMVRSYLMFTFFGYMLAFVWFLIMGVRERGVALK